MNESKASEDGMNRAVKGNDLKHSMKRAEDREHVQRSARLRRVAKMRLTSEN